MRETRLYVGGDPKLGKLVVEIPVMTVEAGDEVVVAMFCSTMDPVEPCHVTCTAAWAAKVDPM